MMQQNALRAFNSLGRDFELTAPSGVSLYKGRDSGPVILGMVPISDVLSDGTQTWDEVLIVYSWKSSGSPLLRKVWKSTEPPACP
jgi:hypothetical protein